METFLLIVAWWVVAGLPFLMFWRASKLLRTKGQASLFYIGSWAIILGVLVWVPFCWMKRIQGMDISVVPYLGAHLALVIPGAILKRFGRRRSA